MTDHAPRRVAVVANRRKTTGGGLTALRAALQRAGVDEPLWFEAARGKRVPRAAQRALEGHPDVLLVWGGDGTVQRVLNAIEGFDGTLAVIPAGSANVLARNLDVPMDIEGAVDTALHGTDRLLDTATVNGVRFVVMCGAGADATVMDATEDRKGRLGSLAYLSGVREGVSAKPFTATVEVDGVRWFEGEATMLLIGNVGELVAGVRPFPRGRPDDGVLDVGIMADGGTLAWARTALHALRRSAAASPHVQATTAQTVDATFDRRVRWEADGGTQGRTRRLTVRVDPASLRVRVPR